MASPSDIIKMIEEKDVKFVDLRFSDTKGKEQHVSVPAATFSESKFSDGHAFDGSSIAGWKGIQASDMLLIPDPDWQEWILLQNKIFLILLATLLNPQLVLDMKEIQDPLLKKQNPISNQQISVIQYISDQNPNFLYLILLIGKIRWKKLLSKSTQKKVHEFKY